MARASDDQDGRTEPLHVTVFRALQAEIARGVYPIGTQLPSEASLVERFGVSRQTVRQALRNLREAGLVTSHQGLGTIVERPAAGQGYAHQIDTIGDLFPSGAETRYRIEDGGLRPLPAWADRFGAIPGDVTWLHVRALRYRPDEAAPFNELDAFVAAPFAGVGRVIETHAGSIYGLIEAIYAEVIDEVEQTIRGFTGDGLRGAAIGVGAGETGIEVDRVYRVKSTGAAAILSVNRYPADKFAFSMTLRRLKG